MSLNNAHEGYDYQDLITSYFILKEILSGNQNSVFSIDKKHTTGNIPDRFDDLVITNGLLIQRKQIKFSNDTVAKKLIKDYFPILWSGNKPQIKQRTLHYSKRRSKPWQEDQDWILMDFIISLIVV